MKIRVLGGGVYGCHITKVLQQIGAQVELHEIADRLFSGASGNMPARLHTGQHYPRSRLTRAACQEHFASFMQQYGAMTHGVAVNVYGIAQDESLLDFGTYKQVLKDEIEIITIHNPKELGIENVEGAILTGERHVLVDRLREFFADTLESVVFYHSPPGKIDSSDWDLTIDCTFCAHDSIGIDRFEACLTVLLEGPTGTAVTIMDGPFPSLYPWNEEAGLSSLTSAKWTPLEICPTWSGANFVLQHLAKSDIDGRTHLMIEQMAHYYPRLRDEYRVADHRFAIRAMPRSAADARLVDVVRTGERAIRIRAGKLDAIFHAARIIEAMLPEFGG